MARILPEIHSDIQPVTGMSGRQVTMADGGNRMQIALIRASRVAAAARLDLCHIGGSRSLPEATPADRLGRAPGTASLDADDGQAGPRSDYLAAPAT